MIRYLPRKKFHIPSANESNILDFAKTLDDALRSFRPTIVVKVSLLDCHYLCVKTEGLTPDKIIEKMKGEKIFPLLKIEHLLVGTTNWLKIEMLQSFLFDKSISIEYTSKNQLPVLTPAKNKEELQIKQHEADFLKNLQRQAEKAGLIIPPKTDN